MSKNKPGLIYVYNAVDENSRAFLEVVEKYEADKAGDVAVSRVDVYKSKGLAERLGVESFPALVCTENGCVIYKQTDNICKDGMCSDDLDQLFEKAKA